MTRLVPGVRLDSRMELRLDLSHSKSIQAVAVAIAKGFIRLAHRSRMLPERARIYHAFGVYGPTYALKSTRIG